MKTRVIPAGTGFNVGVNFARARTDTVLVVDPDAYALPGVIVGHIEGDPASPLGFMRAARVRVHIAARHLAPEAVQS